MKIAESLPVTCMILALACSRVASAENWEPPTSPDPSAILQEARDDRNNGRYALALEKHVWYHENALDIRPSLTGVRTSFALFYWRQLANAYPPALDKLQQIRDYAEESVKIDGDNFDAFRDFRAINRALDEEERTVELFKWLDANSPSGARSAYIVAEDALVAAAEYTLCGKYVGGIERYFDLEHRYRLNLSRTEDGSSATAVPARSRMKYSYEIALLVAILVKNDRPDEGAEIADRALRDWTDHLDEKQILDAKSGAIPTRREKAISYSTDLFDRIDAKLREFPEADK